MSSGCCSHCACFRHIALFGSICTTVHEALQALHECSRLRLVDALGAYLSSIGTVARCLSLLFWRFLKRSGSFPRRLVNHKE